jgi:hypothetical protein
MSQTGPFQLHSQPLAALPIVDHFLARMGLEAVLGRWLPAADRRVALEPGRAVGLIVRNICLARRPIYGIGDWAARFDPRLLGLDGGELELLNDDRVGRALEALFDCDRGSLLCELVLGVIREFEVDCGQLHNDSTSITLHGAYAQADGRQRGGKPTPAAAFGHSKDHRPDLKQLVLTLTVSADGALPLAHRVLDGNTNDDQTHIATWDGLVKLAGRRDFLYVADSKLATREQLSHICARGGRFVTVLPASRAEDAQIRAWAQTNAFEWTEAERRPGRRKDSPPDVWWTAPAPIPTSEGHRIVWVRSSQKHARDADSRQARIERGLGALQSLSGRLAGPRSRLRTRVAVEEAARAALAGAGAERWITWAVSERVEETFRQEKRGRPGNDTRYRKQTKTRFELAFEVDAATVAYAAATDGCFPLVTNDRALTDPDVLAAYRYQPNLEKRYHQLKSVQAATPVLLKSAARIEALLCCDFIALLCSCLIERELRRAMARNEIADLPLYHEDRASKAPTAARVYDLFADVTRHQLHRNGQLVQTFDPELTALQRQVLELLGVPTTSYAPTAPEQR